MNRLTATIIFLLIIVLAISDAIISSKTLENETDLIFAVTVGALGPLLLILYCGFAALHAMQHLDSPQDRTVWFMYTIALNLLGSFGYYLTVYQKFKKNGQSGLMFFRKNKK